MIASTAKEIILLQSTKENINIDTILIFLINIKKLLNSINIEGKYKFCIFFDNATFHKTSVKINLLI